MPGKWQQKNSSCFSYFPDTKVFVFPTRRKLSYCLAGYCFHRACRLHFLTFSGSRCVLEKKKNIFSASLLCKLPTFPLDLNKQRDAVIMKSCHTVSNRRLFLPQVLINKYVLTVTLSVIPCIFWRFTHAPQIHRGRQNRNPGESNWEVVRKRHSRGTKEQSSK